VSGSAAGPERVAINPANPQNLTVTAGKSVILESQVSIKRFSIAAPEIADILVLTPRQLYLTGKAPGVTSLSLWGEGDRLSAVFDVEVTPDMASLKEKLHKFFPNEKDIRVTSARDSITLSGVVSNAAHLPQVLLLAQAYAPLGKGADREKPKVVNLLEVGGVQQVMLEVRVSEMDKTLARNLGINFSGVAKTGNQFGVTTLNSLTSLTGGGISQQGIATGIAGAIPQNNAYPGNGTTVSTNVNAAFRFLAGGQIWTAFIDALQENDLVKVLAKPTLITMSGKRANFLAGGEYPIPVPQAAGTGGVVVTIQYKTFGVALNFIPTVLGNGRISMEVAPEVSELDFTNSVSFNGFVIPSLTTRRVATTVELADGQSFAVAGLLSEQVRETAQKYPFLGDIPILGMLFRSRQFQKNETELVIIVSPHLVKPVDMARQTLPTDQFIEPDDLDFYVLGKVAGSGSSPEKKNTTLSPVLAKGGGLDGDFGYILP
jgi:pilus assembly protein CpaC